MVKFFKKNSSGKLVEFELGNRNKLGQATRLNAKTLNLFSPRKSRTVSKRSPRPLTPIKIPSPGKIAPTKFKPYTYKSISINKPKTFRLNINLKDKKLKQLKRKFPIFLIRRKIEQINEIFQLLIKNNEDIFYDKYEYNSYDKMIIKELLNETKEKILTYIGYLETTILDEDLVNPNTSLYNYYKTNIDKLKYEIEDMLLNIIITNGRVVRYQLKKVHKIIIDYIKDIAN
jgi:hypothetical protein